MKKRTRIAITIMAAVLAAVLLCVGLTACAPPSDDGNPPESQFNVTVVTSNATTTDESLVEMLERIRPTVVDVDAYLPNGTSAGSGVIIGGASADGEDVGENGSYDSYLIVTKPPRHRGRDVLHRGRAHDRPRTARRARRLTPQRSSAARPSVT